MSDDALRASLLAEWERGLGRRLPEDYRRFLLAGPMPRLPEDEEAFAGDDPAEATRDYYRDTLRGFYDLAPADPRWDLAEVRRSLQGVLPTELLAIAEDPGGNLICLGLSGEHDGRVYHWSHDTGDGPGPWDGVVRMSDGFPEFLSRLRERAGDAAQG